MSSDFNFTVTGTPPLTRFFGPGKNRVKGKPRYRRSILVLKPQNGEFENSKSTFSLVFTSVKLQLQSLHLYLFHKVKRNLMQGILIWDIFLFKFKFILETISLIHLKKKIWNFLKKKIDFLDFFWKKRVRWKFSAVFGLEKTALDRIPRYRRTALKEECLYLKLC